MLPYHSVESIASVIYLMPDYFPRSNARLVSCYALFKWWLLPSQHPSCLSIWTSLVQLSIYFGTLADGLGCFPLGAGPYHPTPHCWGRCHSIRSSSGVGRRWSPLAQLVALPLWHYNSTLHLNAFRGVRAISEFDWPFTPTHSSSKHFSTWTGSGLHSGLMELHPGHG